MEYEVNFQPVGRKVKCRYGMSVLQVARDGRIAIKTRCGGNAGCLMCKVEVDGDHASALNPPTAAELRKLGPLLDRGIRLACQATVCGQAVVTLPEDPLKAAIRKQLERGNEDDLW